MDKNEKEAKQFTENVSKITSLIEDAFANKQLGSAAIIFHKNGHYLSGLQAQMTRNELSSLLSEVRLLEGEIVEAIRKISNSKKINTIFDQYVKSQTGLKIVKDKDE